MPHAIETQGLAKHYGETRALNGLNLTVDSGTVYGVLGPNGAGKTTTIRVLSTLLKPTAGTAHVLGLNVVEQAAAVRQKVSLTGQYASVDEDLTGHENLVLVSRLLGMSWGDARRRATELLDAFGLSEASAKQVRSFSGGMRRRIDIAASLVTRPELLFLDEPTTGLDPRSRNQVWDLVRQIAAEGTTVLLTTQYLEEADKLAERMAVVDHGRVIAEGTSRELKASIGGSALRIQLADPGRRPEAHALVTSVVGDGILPNTDSTSLSVNLPNTAAAATILSALSGAGIQLTDFALGAPSLDDVFFALTGRPPEGTPGAPQESAS